VTREVVRIKLELASANQSTLEHDIQVYKDMTGAVGFSSIDWLGTEGGYNVLVTISGFTLEFLFQICKRKISLKTILLLLHQVISRLEDLHAKDYVYGKITPKNLHMGQGKFGAQVSVTSLGHAKKYMVQGPHQGSSINVADRYASINTHKGIPNSYCDDFESWWYVMLHFCRGSLPWEGDTCPEAILEKKDNTTPEELFHGFPSEFASSLGYIKSLPPGGKPDYKYLRTIFWDLFTRLSFAKDYTFDWTFHKHHPDCMESVQYGEGGLLAQLKGPSEITQQQIENEVNSKQHSLRHDIEVEAKFYLEILRDLFEAKKACEKLHEEQSSRMRLTDEQSQALIAAHRKVLNEYCDFFFAAWHPCSTESLRRSVKVKETPSRMWHTGIYSLFQLLRHHSVRHSLTFLRLAYSMVALIMEYVPINEDHLWAEMLGGLARCIVKVSVGDADVSKCWSGVPGRWYNKAADEYPHIGRLQYHLGAIAEPKIIRQLFHFSKALISVTPFPNTWQSLMMLFELFPEGPQLTSWGDSLVESTLVKVHGVLFRHGSIQEYKSLMIQFRSGLCDHIGRLRKEFSQQSSEIAFILCAAARGFGGSPTYDHQKTHVENTQETRQLETYQASLEQEGSHSAASRVQDETYRAPKAIHQKRSDVPGSATGTMLASSTFTDASYIILHAQRELGRTVSVACAGGEEVLPFMHVVLVYLTFIPDEASHVRQCMSWYNISRFVNTLRKHVVESQSETMEFPQQQTIAGRQLPEDYDLRGSSLVEEYFPLGFFDDLNPSTEDRMKERPDYVVYRAKRIWYLAHKLAAAKYMEYDSLKQEFSIKAELVPLPHCFGLSVDPDNHQGSS
jgi:serine/threonine protein kinase